MGKILVTSALPYANGPLHIGHLIGAYLPADVYCRYHRMAGSDIAYICGTDEHGTPIAVAADREGVPPKNVADKYYRQILKGFRGAGISFDNFSRTSRPLHHKISQDFFLTILKNGHIYKRTVTRPFCTDCERFLPDRYVRGTCPACGAKDERGDQCEACGKQLEPHELKDAYCFICHGTPELRETDHWFFRLSNFSEQLSRYVRKCRQWPANARNFSLGWIAGGLEDRAITRDLEWGVPVPALNADGKVLYVWFDAPIGYISSTAEWDEQKWEEWWKGKAQIVHFIGKDNIPFHAIIWPAMLMAHGGYRLPWMVSSNEHLLLEGRKMSTSRGWVVWLHELLEAFSADQIRYSLLIINPAKHDADFTWTDFRSHTDELADNLGNFVYRCLSFTDKQFKKKVPKAGKFGSKEKKLVGRIKAAPKKIGALIENFEFQKALREMMAVAQAGNQYMNSAEPWHLMEKQPERAGAVINLCLSTVRSLAILSAPFLPFAAEEMWRELKQKGSVHDQKWKDAGKVGISGTIMRPKPLFRKIETEEIDAQIEKLEAALKQEVKPRVNIEAFKKLDLRIGKVLSAEKMKGSENLLRLKVDIGTGTRQVIAGIAKHYPVSQLKGKSVVILANLEPRTFKGDMSDGMLLAAEQDGKVSILTIDKKLEPGSKIK